MSASDSAVAVADDRQLRDAVALHQLDRDADLLRRLDRDEVGQVRLLAALEAQHLVDRRRRRRPLEEAVLEHPVVVVELREVRAAAVGQQHQHARVGAESRRDLQRSPRRRPARAADEQALLAREPPRGQERVAVGDADPLVDDLGVHRLAATCPCRSPRRGRGRAGGRRPRCRPSPRGRRRRSAPRAMLLEVAPDAGDRAARADGDHDRVDLPAVGLLPDLRAGRLVVRLGIGHVRVLVGLEAAGDLLGEAVGDRVVGLGRVVVDRGRRDHDLGAVGAEGGDLLLAHLVRHHEDAAVALLRRRRSQARRRCCRRSARRSCRPGRSFPSRSAASIIASPIRSLFEPPGFRNSSFASSVGGTSRHRSGRAARSACRRRGRAGWDRSRATRATLPPRRTGRRRIRGVHESIDEPACPFDAAAPLRPGSGSRRARRLRGVDDPAAADVEPDVPEPVEEDEIARPKRLRLRAPVGVLGRGVVRQVDAELAVDVGDEPGAVESARGHSAVAIRRRRARSPRCARRGGRATAPCAGCGLGHASGIDPGSRAGFATVRTGRRALRRSGTRRGAERRTTAGRCGRGEP